MKRSSKLISGISTGYIYFFLNVAINLAIVPFILHFTGKLEYGLWITIMSIVGYIGLLDFGVATATSKFLSEINVDSFSNNKKIISNSIIIYSILGGMVVFIVFVGMFFIGHFFGLTGRLLEIGSIAFLLAGLNLALSFPLSVFGSVLIGQKELSLHNLINIIGLLLNAFFTIVFLWFGFGIVGIAFVLLVVNILIALVRIYYTQKIIPSVFSGFWCFDRAIFRKILSFGFFMFVLNIGAQIVFNTDNIVIAKILGVVYVTAYAIAFKMNQAAISFVRKIADSFFPFFSELYSSGDKNKLILYVFESTKFSVAIATPVFMVLTFWGKDIISLWVGMENFVGRPAFCLMAIVTLMSSIIYPGAMALQGMGKVKTLVFFNIFEALLNLFFSVFLAYKFGIFGVIFGTVLAMFLTNFWYVPFCLSRELQISLWRYVWETIILPFSLGVSLLFLIYFFDLFIENNNLFIITMKISVLFCLYLLSFSFVCMDKNRRLFYMDKFRSFSLS